MLTFIENKLKRYGPGIIWGIAATGSGELVIASKVGAEYGLIFVWALFISIWLKYWIQKGILVQTIETGTPLVENWHQKRFGTYSTLYWILFFALTATGVAGLIGLCASILTALVPIISVPISAVIVIVTILIIAGIGTYRSFEKSMLLLALVLGIGTIATVALSLTPQVPLMLIDWGIPATGAAALAFLSLLGWGAGSGPDLMLPYSWWVSEKKASDTNWNKADATKDLMVGYAIAGVVATIFMIAGTIVLKPLGVSVEGVGVLTSLSTLFTHTFGDWAFTLFMIPAFAALLSTTLGVFDGGRIALVHLVRLLLKKETVPPAAYRSHRWYQVGLVLFSAVALAIFLGVPKPVLLVMIAGVISAISMPILAMQVWSSLARTVENRFMRWNILFAGFIYLGFTVQALWKLLG